MEPQPSLGEPEEHPPQKKLCRHAACKQESVEQRQSDRTANSKEQNRTTRRLVVLRVLTAVGRNPEKKLPLRLEWNHVELM